MPKLGMEPIRRDALVKATIAEIGRVGSLDVTVSQIAKRAGMSSALAHHYFGGKEQIFLAAMRHTLTLYGASVRGALMTVKSPRERVEAVIAASFEPGHFRPEVVSAWLNFYVLAQTSDQARRLLRVYQKRLNSNLLAGLRPLLGAEADHAAAGVSAMIDGHYIRRALHEVEEDAAGAADIVITYLNALLGEPT